MQSFIKIRCFGRFYVSVRDNRALELPRHAAAIIAVLASSEQAVSREYLADLLWEGPHIAKKRHSLSQTLYWIRKRAATLVVAHPSSVRLTTVSDLDTQKFERAYEEERYVDAIDWYSGGFLDGFPYVSDTFDDWRLARSAHYEELAVTACAAAIEHGIAAEDFATTADTAKKALLIRPLDEAFARARVEALASLGDPARALRELDTYRKRIVASTGAYPDQLPDSLEDSLSRLALHGAPLSVLEASTRLVGRSAELQAIAKHLSAEPLSSRVVLIQGEPGIGKTRVLHHTMRKAAIGGSRTFMYTCAEAESRLPNSGIVGIIRDGFKKTDLKAIGSSWVAVLGELLPELFEFPQRARHPDRIVWEAVAQYFGAIAALGGVAIAVDDLHWMDDSSLDVITYILKRYPHHRIQFIGAGRAPLRAPVYEDGQPATLVVTLQELDPAAVNDLITNFESSSGVDISAKCRSVLRDRVGGRPFFLLQVLAHLRQGGNCLAGDDFVPPHAATYIMRRISALPMTAQDVAQAMAVVNRTIPVQQLSAIVQLDVRSVSRALDALIGSGIVGDHPTPRFSHDLVRQAVLASLSEPTTVAWHARAAAVFADADASQDSIAAHHYEMAGDARQAYKFSFRAAEAAASEGRHRESIDEYARALRCAVPPDCRQVLARYCLSLEELGDFSPIHDHLEDLGAYVAVACDEALESSYLLALFHREETQGVAEPRLSVERAKTILARTQRLSPEKIATVLWQVADAIRRSGERETLVQFARLLARQSKTASSHQRVEMLAAGALLGGIALGYDFAVPLAEKAVAATRALSPGVHTVRARFARGTAMLWAGNLNRSRADLQAALEMAETEAVGPIASIKSNLSIVLLEQGEHKEAEVLALEALREAGANRRAYAFGNLAIIKLRQGHWNEARRYAHALLESNDTTPQPWIPVHAEALIGLADIGSMDLEAAHQRATTLCKRQTEVDMLVDPSHVHLLLARVESMNGNTPAAVRRLTSAIQGIIHLDRVAAARLEVELIGVYLQAQHFDDAQRCLTTVEGVAKAGAMVSICDQLSALPRSP